MEDNRVTLSLKLDDREVRLVPVIIEGYQLEIDGKNVTSFLSHDPPLMRAVAALEARGDFGVGDLETASERGKWKVSGNGQTEPAEND
ncbi:hypothetical protein C8J27_101720 [Rhodobacter aestuarii]|uniref:Uncharacterized protein n=1 Tax=Rhodobacter aestuarii TaxID=453582 RepID=A0A1N7P617_9RHOB|nr:MULTISPECIES: hypothetical protein [Rhodobacter]PTV97603.1 hypothetical protein C8J27_101720 [Rhodobacter aestuarii]SIT05879.1 hypothetical protein SAMN05421580_10980 [Rhodobacter aestuarii]SOC04929.1 hypothetical protein SAMN05877809_103343 [Rhodobacter sp. JA431]